MTWLFELFAGKTGRYAAIAIGLFVVLLLVFSLGRCSHHSDPAASAQAQQTSASSDAIANAASNAVETISNQVVTDRDIDEATGNAIEEVQNATSVDDIRSAVLDGVCSQSAHHNDPACKVR